MLKPYVSFDDFNGYHVLLFVDAILGIKASNTAHEYVQLILSSGEHVTVKGNAQAVISQIKQVMPTHDARSK